MAELTYLLDSNICIYLLEGTSPALTRKVADQSLGSLAISSITLAEVAIGYGDNAASDKGLRHFLSSVEICSFDEAAARAYAALPFRRAGFDRLIAAHTIALDLVLVTNNEGDFSDIPGLRVENWTR